MRTEHEQKEMVSSLRAFADFLETHPTVELKDQRFLIYYITREEIAQYAKLGGWTKQYDGNDWFGLKRTFGSIELYVYTDRDQVCRKIVVGQREVPAMPATEARTEDIIEWVCDESLLAELAK